jgi:hypothetical protein
MVGIVGEHRSPRPPLARASLELTDLGGNVMPRERLDRPNSKEYIRRDDHGRFTEDQVDVGRSLARDRQQSAKTTVRKGEGDRGDQRQP